MAIKNKDGTPYRLNHPNPIMVPQDRWDRSQIVYYNFHSWDEVILIDPKVKQPAAPIPTPTPEVSTFFELPKSRPEPVVVQSPPPVIEEPKKEVETKKEESVVVVKPMSGGVRVHCLPAVYTKVVDNLYGEEKTTISYGNKFEFECKIVESMDLSLVLWTGRKDLTVGSIVYPQGGYHRWWKVRSVEPSGIGFRVYCGPSDQHPSF